MGRKTRRFILGASVVAALVASVPGTAVADTNCGVLVCAEAETGAHWSCGSDGTDGTYWFTTCVAIAVGESTGYSELSVPGSLTWTASTSCLVFSGQSAGFPCSSWGFGADVIEGLQECTWAGLGEDSCGGTAVGVYLVTLWLQPGECVSGLLREAEADVVVHSNAAAVASKSLPVAGQVDSAMAFSTWTASLSAVPDDETTCAPPA